MQSPPPQCIAYGDASTDQAADQTKRAALHHAEVVRGGAGSTRVLRRGKLLIMLLGDFDTEDGLPVAQPGAHVALKARDCAVCG